MIKIVLYTVTSLLAIWILEGIRIETIFKKGRSLQIKVFFFLLVFSLSYLVTNFIYDFCIVPIIIR